ncbi:hypothetical protein [Thalassobacillus pellis]|uniref:hypothetical protein n=1 Tax=Thalassobacillus pellis TaxID=748008 RepID=UPI0019607F23|nr:hypothetical protein [Thalassobacillus pellis]MBM7554188.1 hypothetical protein [Thalassobacillus pellis]
MKNETYLDFCFIRSLAGGLAAEVEKMFTDLFKNQRLNWYLDYKVQDGAEIVVAEVKGMSSWKSEEAVIDHLETNADDSFWKVLQGYQFHVYPAKGCSTCGTR